MGQSNSSDNASLSIITSTWTQQSHGLYDFSDTNVDKRYSMLAVKKSTNLYRNGHDISGLSMLQT